MKDNNQHMMLLIKSYPSCAEEWFCPFCGRRFILQWAPEMKKIVLAEGDELAAHFGANGELSLLDWETSQDARPGVPPDLDRPDRISQDSDRSDPNLRPWIEWAEKVDLNRLWGDAG